MALREPISVTLRDPKAAGVVPLAIRERDFFGGLGRLA